MKGQEICSHCGGFSDAGGIRLDGVLSRQRVRSEAEKFEGDTLNPWTYSKNEKAYIPNEDFIKRHASNAHNFFKDKDLIKSHPKLAGNAVKREKQEKSFGVGEYEPRFKEVIKG